MLPQLKLISLIVRVFARPIITSRKDVSIQKAQMNKNSFMTQQMLNLGNAYYLWDQKIDRMYLNQNLKDDYEQLVDNEALKLGTEFFLEILIYITLLVVSTFEIYKTYHAQNDRQQNINKTISTLQDQIHIIKNKKLEDLKELQIIDQNYQENLRQFQIKYERAVRQIAQIEQLYTEKIHKNMRDK